MNTMETVMNDSGTGPILRACGIKRIFGRGNTAVTALENIDLNIPPGTIVALRGRSGSGKTTLLNILSALDDPTEGQVYFKGREITGLSGSERSQIRRREIGLVFQSYGLMPLMSAYENVEFGLRIAGLKGKRDAVEDALDRVGMRERMKHLAVRAVRRRTAARSHCPRDRPPARPADCG